MSDELELGGDEGGRQSVVSRLIEDEMRESFIDYSMSVIVQRALPDVRDGLKPVHRRILYAMSEAGLTPGRAYKNSATVIGDVFGTYHPHGDSAVYASMVRHGPDFPLRYPPVSNMPRNVRYAAGSRVIFTVIFVQMPNVPSLPTNKPVRS